MVDATFDDKAPLVMRPQKRRIHQQGERFIQQCEGLLLTAYRCPAGVWTIGYGHTDGVFKGQVITREDAMTFLRRDLEKIEARIVAAVKVPLNDDQFAALVSFVFNVGERAFMRSSLLRKLNDGQYNAIPDELKRWVKIGTVVSEGLVARRFAESQLWQAQVK